jgi:transcriptional regulator with XRE-family HTH domain
MGDRMNSQELAAKLRMERRIKELTQQQVAEAVGLDRDHISGFETGSKHPRLHTFVAWADRLGFEVIVQPKAKP